MSTDPASYPNYWFCAAIDDSGQPLHVTPASPVLTDMATVFIQHECPTPSCPVEMTISPACDTCASLVRRGELVCGGCGARKIVSRITNAPIAVLTDDHFLTLSPSRADELKLPRQASS